MSRMRPILQRLNRYTRRRLLGEGVVNFRGRGIVNLIDVGSAGALPSPWQENAKMIQHMLRFEPRSTGRSANPNIVSVDAALWETECERDFYTYKGRGGSGSSLFEQNRDYVTSNWETLRSRGPERLAASWLERPELSRVERIALRTLDDVLAELNQPFRYHFLKIDAQGAEYEILKGGELFLGTSCGGLHLELFTLPLYKGIKLHSEVQAYLNGLDFDLVRQFPAHGSFDSQHDCLFLKRGAHGKIADTIREVYRL